MAGTTDPELRTADAADPRPARPIKKSFSIAGPRTSVSLEAAFWDALAAAAKDGGTSQAAIVQQVDRSRGDAGLSSALRVWLLKRAQGSGCAS